MENNRIQQIRQYVQDIPAMLEKKRTIENDLNKSGTPSTAARFDSFMSMNMDCSSKITVD